MFVSLTKDNGKRPLVGTLDARALLGSRRSSEIRTDGRIAKEFTNKLIGIPTVLHNDRDKELDVVCGKTCAAYALDNVEKLEITL